MFHNNLFGENVFIFSPEDNQEEIREALRHIDRIHRAGHFTKERCALLFHPGIYKDIEINVGFFTQVLGLGILPSDTKLKRIQCTALWNPNGDNNEGLANFWRGAENLEIMEDTLWAVSQASPMRRMLIDKNLYLHENGGYTSGGFLGDSIVRGFVDHGSQQQWLTRNSSMDHIKTYGWNQVFMGCEFKHRPTGAWPEIPVTILNTVTEIQEKPFLIYDKDKGYGIFVPKLRKNSRGVSWACGVSPAQDASVRVPGRFIPICDCYIAKPGIDSAASINEALACKKHLILTPGIYQFDEPLYISQPDTIVLGLGLATISSVRGNACMVTANVPGIIVAGLLFDAGQTPANNLLIVGDRPQESKSQEHQTDAALLPPGNQTFAPHYSLSSAPVVLCDLFFRVGGFPALSPSTARNCVEINSSHVIGDHLWIWRADHSHQVGWEKNTAQNGIIINGSDVTMYALMVEHFLEYQTLWNGDYGRLYMYQSEMPYDAPCQDAWMSHSHTKNGYASLKVSEKVTHFESWCAGIYSYHRDAPVVCHSAVEVPDKENVVLHHTFDLHLNGHVGISHVINEAGNAVSEKHRAVKIITYKNGIYEEK